MFQLDTAITHWRNGLLVNQNIQDSDVDELENHLRDEIDSLILLGLNHEEAFMISTHRIGDQQTVGQEFAKVNTKEIWRNRLFWMLSGVFVFMVIGSLSSFSSAGTKLLLAWLKINPAVSGIISSLIYVLIFMGAIFILVGCLSGLSSKVHQRYRTLRNVLWQGILLIFLLQILTVFVPVFYTRFYSVAEYGEVAKFSIYIMGSWKILWPILLAGLLFWLRPSKRKIVQ